MSNKDNRSFIPTFKYYTRNGVTSSVGSARMVEIYKTTGYNGPFPSTRPLPLHPYSMVKTQANAYVREIRNWGTNDVSIEEGHAMSRSPTQLVFDPPQDYTQVYARALEKLNEKVRGGVDLSVDLLQAGQLKRLFNATEKLEMFTKVFSSKAARRGLNSKPIWEQRAVNLAKLISSQHLEFIYGVKPLVSSIFGAAEERIRYVNNKLRSVRVRANDYSWKPSRVYLSTVYGALYRDLNVYHNSKLSVTLGITYKDSDPDWENFTSLNPISIAWELLPYSFVVDWVYNIGGYLRAVETSMLYANRFDSGYRTNFVALEAEGSQTYKYTSSPTGTNDWFVGVSLTAFERSILTQYPSLDRPILEVDLGSSRLLAAASLLAQHLGRRPPGPRVI